MKIPLIQLCGFASLLCGIGSIRLASYARRCGYMRVNEIFSVVALTLAIAGLGALTIGPVVG